MLVRCRLFKWMKWNLEVSLIHCMQEQLEIPQPLGQQIILQTLVFCSPSWDLYTHILKDTIKWRQTLGVIECILPLPTSEVRKLRNLIQLGYILPQVEKLQITAALEWRGGTGPPCSPLCHVLVSCATTIVTVRPTA
jgi:hypothetical protein